MWAQLPTKLTLGPYPTQNQCILDGWARDFILVEAAIMAVQIDMLHITIENFLKILSYKDIFNNTDNRRYVDIVNYVKSKQKILYNIGGKSAKTN